MLRPLWITASAAFAVLVSLALGKLLLRRLRFAGFREEETTLGFACGSAMLSLLVFGLCAAHLAYKAVFLATGAVILAAAWRAGIHRPQGDPLPPLAPFWRWLFRIPFAVSFAFYFVHALAPEMSPDGAGYHLSLVQRYLRERGLVAIPTNMYANLSQGAGMLYTFAFAFGRHSAAALVHFSFLTALAFGLREYGRRLGQPAAGVAAALLIFLSPVFGVDGTSAYNDVALAFILFSLFHLLQVQPGLGGAVGLLAGFAFGIKYTGFVAVPYALVESWRLTRRWRHLPVLAAAATLMIAPWLLKNWIFVHNPVAPFFTAVFPNPNIHPSFEKEYAASMRHYDGLAGYSQIPLEVTVRGRILGGFFGPAFLLAPLALLALRQAAGRRALAAALVFALPYPANIGTRFLLPAAPLLAVALALALSAWRPLVAVVVLAHTVLSWPSMARRYCEPLAWRLAGFPIRAALRLESEDDFLVRHNSAYAAVRMVERLVGKSGRVFVFAQIPEAYTQREILVGFQAAPNEVIRDILLLPMIPERVPNGVLTYRFPARPLRAIRAVETGSAPPGGDVQWSVGEMRLYHAGREIERASGWRLRAQPNPWDVQMAFDNSPATRWRSWQAMAPGMSIAVDFGRAVSVDAAVLEVSRDQYESKVRIEGLTESGRWELLSDTPLDHDGPPPLGLRRAAIEEVKSRGITHLLIFDSQFGADDFRTKSALWGIVPVGESYGARLYQLQ